MGISVKMSISIYMLHTVCIQYMTLFVELISCLYTFYICHILKAVNWSSMG